MTSMGPRLSGRLMVSLLARPQGRAGPGRALVPRFAALLVTATLFGACGAPSIGSDGSPGASDSPGPGADSELAPRDISGAAADAADNPGDLPAPPADPESGDVPPAEPATPAVTGQLTLGSRTSLASQTIGAGGGSIKVARPGDPLDGLVITVPSGTYAADVLFAVSEQSISGSSFGAGIRPISPLISIDNGGVVAGGAPVLVTIPATVPADATAVGLYYDAAGGMLHPLAVSSSDTRSVTLAAAHFSDIFLALIDMGALPATVDSGFRPGVDDWEFPNYGSYVAPDGHCEGQVDSEIWYYVNQRRGAGASPLYGLYDNNGAPDRTPTFWQDDSDGYRLASTVQAGPHTNPGVWQDFSNLDNSGTVTYDLLRLAIGLTGEPQELGIWDAAEGQGHAIAVYRVTPTRVYVADPNYPGRLRTIRYDAATGALGPYSSGDSAGSIATAGAVSYTHFAYIPVAAAHSAATMASLWAELEANAAGNTTFPSYRLLASSGKDAAGKDVWVPLVDGFETNRTSLPIQVTRLDDAAATSMAVYLGTATTMRGSWGWFQTLNLAPGENSFGMLIYAKKGDAWHYVDFVRLTVNGPAPSPAPTLPAPSFGEPVSRTIKAIVPIGGDTSTATCPAEVTLRFTPSGGDSTASGAAFLAAAASLSAHCTSAEFTAIDAAGTFDGHSFALQDGRWSYTGTFDGSTATLSGGPRGVRLVFPAGS
ncbi:MAG: hypothetical protein ACP5VP_06430 [Candidatus Limnocylindrales bacterium]